jgi:hypothetical protein
MLVGLLAGQIRSLRGFSWFTNVNIWLNLLLMVLTMIGVALFDPIPSQSGHVDLSEPIMRAGWVPSYTIGWYQQVSGVQLAVFAYGGAMIFTGGFLCNPLANRRRIHGGNAASTRLLESSLWRTA